MLIVWDGMRPDFITEEGTPNLWKLAQSGVNFSHHHSVYPSLTSVNSTAFATGVFPSRSGMIANWAFRPEISGGKLARMDAPDIIRRGDELSGGGYLAAPTIAELVRARGGRVRDRRDEDSAAPAEPESDRAVGNDFRWRDNPAQCAGWCRPAARAISCRR